jgi:predicted amidohydrolase YtcJ
MLQLRSRIALGVLICELAFGPWVTAGDGPADLILSGGKIVTLNSDEPQVAALAVAGERILALGEDREVLRLSGAKTRFVNLKGRLVVPGFIECHAHVQAIGRSKLELNVVGTKNEAQVADLVRRRAAEVKQGQWIVGRGWDESDWPERHFPDHQSLSNAAPENPVLLARVDGHAIWVNAVAMKIAGLTAETADVEGGRIYRDGGGKPTGVLIDRAMGLITKHVPAPSRAEIKEALRRGMQECLALGITTVHDAGCGESEVAAYRELLAAGGVPLRVYVMLWGTDEPLLAEHFRRGPEIGLGGQRVTIRSIKLMADGALGSRGAALLEPYQDEPKSTGLLILSEDQVFHVADQALRHGFQVCTHAIGDRANRMVLDAYERAFALHPEAKDPRFRIEHAQILDERDIPRFGKLGVIASMQPTHCTSDMPWVTDRIGNARAAEGAYVWQKLLRSGARIASGSDAPVESLNPLFGLFAAVTRHDHQGKPPGGWFPDQRMSREQALRSFTLEGAYAGLEEDDKGSFAKGKLADLVVLSHDILTVPTPKLLATDVLMTIVGGRVAYEQSAAKHIRNDHH